MSPAMLSARLPSSESVMKCSKVLSLCAAYIASSAALIRFNKFLVDPTRFPYPMQLSTLHMAFSLFMCMLLYGARPAAFPGMAATEGKRLAVLKWFVPIGLTFAVSLFASNKAYVYANVTFLQFMKEGNVILTFLLSCAVGLQKMDRVKALVILWIVLGSTMCVTSELKFVLLGFIFQLVSQVCECSRVVLGEFVLSGSNLKLDPLTYTMFAAPVCLVVLLVGDAFTWNEELPARAASLWHFLLPNMSLAFLLNVLVATLIKECSAVGFIICGVTKDIVLVVASAIYFKEPVLPLQWVSFGVVLAGILFWSLMKACPENVIVVKTYAVLGLQAERKVLSEKTEDDEEKKPLLSKV